MGTIEEDVSSLSTEGGAGGTVAPVLYSFLHPFSAFTYLYKPHKHRVGLPSILPRHSCLY